MSASPKETYSLAHTARCKLQLAADRPDRNLRFILGHAFTLDKVMLRVVEIESESSAVTADPEDDDDVSAWAAKAGSDRPALCGDMQGRRVSFQNMTSKPIATLGGAGAGGVSGRNRSPPAPPRVDNSSSEEDDEDDDHTYDRDEDDDDDDIAEDDEGSDGELSLRRFRSGAEKPPMLVDDTDSESDEDERDEPVSPEQMPSDAELQKICNGPESKELAGLYQDVKRCPCHGHDAPGVERVWEWPKKVGEKRIAVVQFSPGGDL